MSVIVGIRPNAAINSNRWAGRTLSQQFRRKNWVPPDLLEQRHDIDRISHYSRKDYVIGETSQDVLRSIADRLTNGPSPVGAVPELDSSGIESGMAELSSRRSMSIEVWGDLDAVELEATPIVELPASHGPTNWSMGETSVSELSGNRRTSGHSGRFSRPDDLQADRDHASHDAIHQAFVTDPRWQQAYSSLTHQGPSSQERDGN